MENQDFEAIGFWATPVKGTGGGYGFDAITEMGHALEEAGQKKNVAAIRQVVAALEDYLQAVEVVFHEDTGSVSRNEDAG